MGPESPGQSNRHNNREMYENSPPKWVVALIRGEITKWAKVVKDGNIKAAE